MLRFLLVFLISMTALTSWAYPVRPITLVVGFPAGSAPDIAARLVAKELAPRLGQPVVIENRVGAAGTIAAAALARAEPDGYTLMFGSSSSLTLGPAVYKNVRFDPNTSFAPIGQVVSGAFILSVRSDLPVTDVKSLVDYARANPGKLTYGSSGNGSLHHLCVEMIKSAAGIDIRHIPYKGSPPNWLAMNSGEIDLTCDSMTNSSAALQSKKVRAVAVTSEARMPLLPQVRTFREQGYPQVNADFWYGLLAPAGTPQPVVARLHAALVELATDPDIVDYFKPQGIAVLATSPQDFAGLMRREFATFSELAQRVGAKVD